MQTDKLSYKNENIFHFTILCQFIHCFIFCMSAKMLNVHKCYSNEVHGGP